MNTAQLLIRVQKLESTVKNIDWRVLNDPSQYQLAMLERQVARIKRTLYIKINRSQPGIRNLSRPFYYGRPINDPAETRPQVYRAN